jgi:hypothetical protein
MLSKKEIKYFGLKDFEISNDVNSVKCRNGITFLSYSFCISFSYFSNCSLASSKLIFSNSFITFSNAFLASFFSEG